MNGSHCLAAISLFAAVLMVDMAAVDMEGLEETVACPSVYNPANDLEFVNPRPDHLEIFPPYEVISIEGSLQMFRCCGTGFNSVRWYYNNELITRVDERFTISDMEQSLQWFRPGPAGVAWISCELVQNETSTLRHDMRVQVLANCPVLKPYYTIQPEDECAEPGDTVTFQCEVYFGDNKCIHPFFKDIWFWDSYGEFVSPAFDGYRNAIIQTVKADDRATSIWANLTFHDVTEKQLNTTYFCMPRKHDYMKTGFKFLGPCQNNTKYTISRTTDSKLATQIAIPVLILALALILIGGIIYLYRMELRILMRGWWGPTSTDSHVPRKYDAYIICSKNEDDQNFLVKNLMKELEQYYKLCVPDRDFPIGSVIPVEITEYVKKSKLVIAITSTSLLQTDYCDLSLDVAVANDIPIIFVKPTADVESSERQKFNTLVSERPKLSAALSVSKVLRYPQKADESSLATFYNSLYSAMPLANKMRETDFQANQMEEEGEEKLS